MGKRNLLILLGLSAIVFLATACAATTTTASCAFVVGDGVKDSRVHKIIYPGQSVPTMLDNEKIFYIPCNSRNYIVNNGGVTNANGERVGDRFDLIRAATKTGTRVKIGITALWTLNQDPAALEKFWTVCLKYNCAIDRDQSGGANYSTPGWNGMLGEVFSNAINSAARNAAIVTDDDIWQKQDPEQFKALGDQMSALFSEEVRKQLGFPEDLFCGSGNSQWEDPANPGKGEFICSPVRILVDSVELDKEVDTTGQGAQSLNEQRLENARTIYGPFAEFFLGLQDSINACKGSGQTCVFNIGASDNPLIVPAVDPTPVPTPAK